MLFLTRKLMNVGLLNVNLIKLNLLKSAVAKKLYNENKRYYWKANLLENSLRGGAFYSDYLTITGRSVI